MRKNTPVYVVPEPRENGRFLVYVDGGMEQWTIEMIKRAVEHGADLREWK